MLTEAYNCLLICDEVQTGFGRTGKLMANEWDLAHYNSKPDIIAVGKALSGGVLPVSAIFADSRVMDALQLNDHGSTFGGNPMAMAVAKAAVEVLVEEGMIENSLEVGTYMQNKFKNFSSDLISDVRGRGLLIALEIDKSSNVTGHDLCNIMMKHGVITKATKDYIIRFTPSLVITKQEANEVSEIVEQSLYELE